MVATPVTFADVEAAIRVDYEHLCGEFSLLPVTLDIYLVEEKSNATSLHNTLLKNETPAYNGRLMVIPINPADLTVLYTLRSEYPPSTFDAGVWQQWRIELWHEVAHQLQDQRLKLWNKHDGADGHKAGWMEALELLGSPFGVTGAVLRRFV